MVSVADWLSYPAPWLRLLSFIGIEIHWAILQYVIGLPFMAFIALLLYIKSGDRSWERFARTLAKAFVMVFAVGAATGTASEFGLVLLWPNLTEAAGRYIYFPLYMEIFAFMMEVVFIYLLWYGWNKLPAKALAVVAFLGFLGAWYSAAMILSVNSFMVAPPGIEPAYLPNGTYLYGQGYPKIEVYLPKDLVPLLNVTALQKLAHVDVQGVAGDSVKAAIPVKVVQQLVREAWGGVRLKDSILAGFVNTTTVSALTFEQVEQLARKLGVPTGLLATSATTPQELLLNVPVKNLLDYILMNTIVHENFMLVTFKSPVYIATLMHTIGSALTVSAFTAFAGYALRALTLRGRDVDPDYRRYVEKALKFTAVFSAVAIAYQGFIAGHEMGVAIALWNPEKFAAMEGTSSAILSLSKLLGTENLMPLIAYGSPSAKLPVYDKIPSDYCKCMLAGTPPVTDCRPPIILHYIYYAKIGLALLLGIYGLIIGLAALRDRISIIDKLLAFVGIREGYGRPMLALAPAAAIVAQAVSTMGWVVREVGRKPWTIYGVMTVDVARTATPIPTWQLALVAVFFVAVVLALTYAAYRILWVPGKEAA